MVILHSLPDALLVCFSSRTNVLHCLVFHWRWVTLKDLYWVANKRKGWYWRGSWATGPVCTFWLCQALSTLCCSSHSFGPQPQNQHIWTLPMSSCTPSVSCGASWCSLFLYSSGYKDVLASLLGLREKNMCCPSGMKWDILQGPFLVLMQSFIIISTTEVKESEYCF